MPVPIRRPVPPLALVFSLACALAASPAVVHAQGHQHPAPTTTATASPAARADAARAQAVITALFAAAERGDLAALDTLYAGDSLTVGEGAGLDRGWANYRDHHLAPELKEFRNFRYRPRDIEVRVAGDLAWAIYSYALSADMGERKVDVVGRGTAILERQGNRWVVRHTQTASRARRPSDPPMP